MDEEGHMWFECKGPIIYVQDNDHSFPARLHFYRKGYNYYMDVSGSATIVNSSTRADETILLKMDVNNIEYAEPQATSKNWFNLLIEKSYNWFVNRIVLPGNAKPFLTKLQPDE